MAGEIYLQLVVDFADDEKVRALARYGRAARGCRDLYVQMILHCRKKLTDGHVRAEQVGVLVYPDSPKVGQQDVRRLVEVGLVEETDSGYYVPGYLKRNPSRAEVESAVAAKSAGAAASNHRRWHVARGRRDPDCPQCTDSESDQSGVTRPIATPIAVRRHRESTETETETETENDSSSRSSARRARATRIPDGLALAGPRAQYAHDHGMARDIAHREFTKFANWHGSKGSKHVDWDRAWLTWVLRWQENTPKPQLQPHPDLPEGWA